jgi:hypothetical protein
MEPKIITIIPKSNFENVRDQVGLVLFTELSKQIGLGSIPDTDVLLESAAPANSGDNPAVNIILDSSNFLSGNHANAQNNQTQRSSQGYTTFFLDVTTSGVATEDKSAGQQSAFLNHRICGMCMYILMSSFYRTLGLPLGTIGGLYVDMLATADPHQKEDTDGTRFSRISIGVRILEESPAWQGVPLLENNTKVGLALTEKGYKFVHINS